MLAAIDNLYDDMLRFAKNYLGDFEQSSLAKVSIAASTLVKDIFMYDIDVLFGDVDSYVSTFNAQYGDILELIGIYFSSTKTCLKELEQLVAYAISHNATNTFLPTLQTNCQMRTELMLGTMTQFVTMSKRHLASDPGTMNEYMPMRLTQEMDICTHTIGSIREILGRISPMIGSLGMAGGESIETYSADLLKYFRGNNTDYIGKIPRAEVCLDEYPKVRIVYFAE